MTNYNQVVMRNPLLAYPFIRSVIPLILGILLQIQTNLFDNITIPAILFVFCLLIFVFEKKIIPKSKRFSFRWLGGAIMMFAMLLIGIIVTNINTSKADRNLISPEFGESLIYGYISEEPSIREKSVRYFFQATNFSDSIGWKSTNAKILLYIQKDSNALSLKLGNYLIINTNIKEIQNDNNPGEFKRKEYFSYKHIHLQAYANEKSWKKSSKTKQLYLKETMISIRNFLLDIFRKNGLKDDEFAVASALTIGYTSEIDPEIRNVFSHTGAMHILSVSGLHVGVIFIIINYLLSFLDKAKKIRFVKPLAIIIFLWFYAILSGMSPSVLRSALMFSLVVIGGYLSHSNNIYNNLAVSAFILLLFNPFFLMDVGFQLSYIALISIVAIHPLIDKWFEPRNWFGKQVWALVSVSIAAQLGSFAICLYYFHQFPNMFLLTNIAAIPLSTIILYLGVALFIFAPIPFVSAWIGKAMSFTTWAMNKILQLIDQMPYSYINGIHFSLFQTILFYIILLALLYYFLYPSFKKLLTVGIAIVFLLVQMNLSVFQKIQTQRLVVMNINKSTAIMLQSHSGALCFVDSTLFQNKSMQDFIIKSAATELDIPSLQIHLKDSFIKNVNTELILHSNIKFSGNSGIFVLNNQKILFVDNQSVFRRKYTNSRMSVDYAIISDNAKVSIAELTRYFDIKKIIIDSSNKYARKSYWKKQIREQNLNAWFTSEKGAFICDLEENPTEVLNTSNKGLLSER